MLTVTHANPLVFVFVMHNCYLMFWEPSGHQVQPYWFIKRKLFFFFLFFLIYILIFTVRNETGFKICNINRRRLKFSPPSP